MARVRYLLVLLVAFWGMAHAALPACVSGQATYGIENETASDDTPAGACYRWAAAMNVSVSNAWDYVEYLQGYCLIQRTDTGAMGSRRVIKHCEPGEAHWADPTATTVDVLKPGQVADYMAIFWAFLTAGICVLCAKAVYNKFRIDNHGA